MSLAKTPEQKQALQLALARLEFGRPFFMPPNVPTARVPAIRRAFDATMKDPEFIAEAEKLKIDIDPMTGEEVASMLEEIAKTPADRGRATHPPPPLPPPGRGRRTRQRRVAGSSALAA